jgi:phospholipase C
MGEGPQTSTATGRGGRRRFRLYAALGAVAVLGATGAVSAVSLASTPATATAGSPAAPATGPAGAYSVVTPAATPIKHLVVIFGENISYDHYFGTYPHAANTDGSPFQAKPGTPKVNGLTQKLLTNNPNSYNPARLGPSQALTCDQDHGYKPEQQAFDNGKMDKFVQFTETASCSGTPKPYGAPGLVMDYYDGNTVTGLWNYAQNYAMSDNSYDTNFGPSTPGAVNLVSGQDGGGYAVNPATGAPVSDPGAIGSPDSQGTGTIYGDLDPAYDDCTDSSHTSASPAGVATGPNIGDLLNARHVTWGWFQGGFAPTGTNGAGYAVCGSSHQNVGGATVTDYSPHHEPFQYYKSTANPKHLPPSSVAAIGRTDQANHQYDISDFGKALSAGNLPAVSFLKAAEYQDGHAGYSDPLDEQHFVVNTINQVEKSPDWRSTAVVLAYDDSDGWYDHQNSPRVNGSHDPALDQPLCTSAPVRIGTYQDRCGYGPRLPFLVISPYARTNYVSHNVTDQTSPLGFIEDNWLGGHRIGGGSFDAVTGSLDGPGGLLDFRTRPHDAPVLLDPATGEVTNR